MEKTTDLLLIKHSSPKKLFSLAKKKVLGFKYDIAGGDIIVCLFLHIKQGVMCIKIIIASSGFNKSIEGRLCINAMEVM